MAKIKVVVFAMATVGIAFTGLAATTEVANAVGIAPTSVIPTAASHGPAFVSLPGP